MKEYQRDVVIVEGVNGAGKTTVARHLAKVMGGTDLRLWRAAGADHHDRQRLQSMGEDMLFRPNHHPEDVFVAAMLARGFRVEGRPVILDRAMPSAFFYDAMAGRKDVFPTTERGWRAIAAWEEMMEEAGAVLVLLNCEYETARLRSTNDVYPLARHEYDKLQKLYNQWALTSRIPLLRFNTALHRPSAIVNRVLSLCRGEVNARTG